MLCPAGVAAVDGNCACFDAVEFYDATDSVGAVPRIKDHARRLHVRELIGGDRQAHHTQVEFLFNSCAVT